MNYRKKNKYSLKPIPELGPRNQKQTEDFEAANKLVRFIQSKPEEYSNLECHKDIFKLAK
jgi:hypothetical protein